MVWVAVFVNFLVGLVCIVAGVMARKTSSRGGILFIVAGVLELLTTACTTTANMVARSRLSEGYYDSDALRIMQAADVGFSCMDLVFVAVLVAALVSIAKAIAPSAARA